MSRFKWPFRSKRVEANPLNIVQSYLAFLKLVSPAEGYQFLKQHPDLLAENADDVIKSLALRLQSQLDAQGISSLSARTKLIQQCRLIGIDKAFAEVGLEVGGQLASKRTPVATQLVQDLRRAQEAEQGYLRTGDRATLDTAAAAWSRVLADAVFASAQEDFQLTSLNAAGAVFLRLYLARGRVDDLNRALQLWKDAVQRASTDSPDLPMYLTNLASGLREQFALMGQEADLEDAIRIYQQAVQLTPPASPELPGRLTNLGNGLRDRFALTGRESDLEEAIQVFQMSVQATPPDSPDLPTILTNLGNGLRDRFALTGRESDLEEAIRVFQMSVQATPPDSPDLPTILSNLGTGLHERFARSGREADLDEAIRVSRQAIEATPSDSPDLSIYLHNLGNSLRDRFARSGREVDLSESIRVSQQAVRFTPPDSPDLPSRLSSLGAGLSVRFERTGREVDLDEAIRVWQQAVQLTPPDSPKLTNYLNNLGSGLLDRFARTGQEADLNESIRISQQAVRFTSQGSLDLPKYLANLANGLLVRFQRMGRGADLDEGIRLYRQAAEAAPPRLPDLSTYLNNLGGGLSVRFDRTGQQEDLEEAIRVFQQALEATPPDSPDLSGRLNNLGDGLCKRFQCTGRGEDLEEAIRVSRQAVETTTADSPGRPMYLHTLGVGLSVRFGRMRREPDLEEAIRVFQQVLDATPLDSPHLAGRLTAFGNSLRYRFESMGLQADLDEAIRVWRRACEIGAVSEPKAALDAARIWGRWALQREQWGEAAEAYGYGLDTGRRFVASQLHRKHKESWLRDLQEMSGAAAYALAKLGDNEGAAAKIERGRARLLREAIKLNRRDLEQLPARGHEDLYRRYLEIVEKREQLTQPATIRPDKANSLRGEALLEAIAVATVTFDQVVAQIQQVPGYEDFLAEPTFAQIAAAAGDTPTAYLLATSVGGLVLLVYNGDVQAVWLNTLTDERAREWLRGPTEGLGSGGWLRAYLNWLAEDTQQALQDWFVEIDEVTHQLWTHIMEPLAAALRQRLHVDPSFKSVVTLIPVGLLALLPLHAAGTEDDSTPTGRRYFLDEFTVNYIPSALALGHARDAAVRMPANRLVAVENPLSAGASRLPNVHTEVTAIAELFDSPVILARASATRRAVLDSLSEAHVVHFACHGSNNWQSPLESGLLMADEETDKHVLLTVGDLLESHQAGGRLVTLSACETGIVGTSLPDEAIALPSALLQAGFAGVAASLWSVADISTSMLMERFYRFWRVDKFPPPQALRAAQMWLRDTTNREKAEYFKRYSPEFSSTRTPEGVAVDIFNEAINLLPDNLLPDGRDFAHPFWWAAFYLTGV